MARGSVGEYAFRQPNVWAWAITGILDSGTFDLRQAHQVKYR